MFLIKFDLQICKFFFGVYVNLYKILNEILYPKTPKFLIFLDVDYLVNYKGIDRIYFDDDSFIFYGQRREGREVPMSRDRRSF